MEPYPQGFLNIRPLVIQPIDNQGPSDVNSSSQGIDFPLSSHYGTLAQAAVSTSGYIPNPSASPHCQAGVDQHIPAGQNSSLATVSVPSTGLLNTGKALEYSWHEFDGQRVPAITPEKFVPVKVIEQKILSFFPNTFPLQTKKRPPLRSIPMKLEEISLLNSLNKRYNFGVCDFKEKDVMVKLDDFTEFYETIRLYYPQCVKDLKSSVGSGNSFSRAGDTFGSGWIQVNNTVLPYVKHGGNAFLPVDVIVNAAKLPVDEKMTTVLPSRLYETLNDMCSILKRNIVFDENTAVLPLHILEETAKGLIRFIQYLPSNDPKKYAKYIPEISESSGNKKQKNASPEDELKKEYDTTTAMDNASELNRKQADVDKENVKPKDVKNEEYNPCKEEETSVSHSRDTVRIETMLCEGKTLQCLHRKEGTFVLMEALLRVFFPELSIEDFAGGVEVVLGVDIPECTLEEEKAFISVYRIPSESLKCKKLVITENLEQNLPILRRMFQMAFHTSKARKKETAASDKCSSQSDVICID